MSVINWMKVREFQDIEYEKAEGIAKITINRPHVRNAFRPLTVKDMRLAFEDAREDSNIGVIILTGKGKEAFCSGGDQKVRGDSGYKDDTGAHRLNVLELQRQIRTMPKPVIAMVAGYAIGGGNVLQMMCDLTLAADNAVFGQTGPRVGSFDGGYGSSYMARIVGQKKAREIWFLCRKYSAQQALEMGLVNHVVSYEKLEEETVKWCKEILMNSPLAIRCLKATSNVHYVNRVVCRFMDAGLSSRRRKMAYKERFAISKVHFGLPFTLWSHCLILLQMMRRGSLT